MDIAILQINNSFSGQSYLPYSAAILQSYFQNVSPSSSEYNFLPFIYKRDSVSNIINQIGSAQVLGLSLYAWNSRLSLAVAQAFREINRSALIFAGGPSVPDDSENFLRQNPFIDIALHNEGEIPFTQLLQEYAAGRDYSKVQSSSRIVDNHFVKNPNAPRISDLKEIPSPFLNGSLDLLIKQNPTEKWIGLWETNRGCPFTCTYCDWGSATGSKKIGMFETERLSEEMLWFASNKIEYIFCCDANFGMFPRDPQVAEMVGEIKNKYGYPHALSVQNTKNSTERSYQTQKILCDYGLNKGVTLSMQTLSETALKNIKRSNIRLASYFELQKRFIGDSVPTYSDLILALPGETLQSYMSGLCQLIESGQHNRIQFNNLSILPNAEMAKPEYIKEHGIKTVTTDIVNMHGSLTYEDKSIVETQELVISTKTLTLEDWKEVRAVSWLTSFLYFNKTAQVPIAITNGVLGVPFHQILECFRTITSEYPVLYGIYQRLVHEADAISKGGPEYVYSDEYLSIYWPIDELLFIELVTSGKVKDLYLEIHSVLLDLVEKSCPDTFSHYGQESISEILLESISFNNWLLNEPRKKTESFECFWSIPDLYKSRLNGTYSNIERHTKAVQYCYSTPKYFDVLEEWLQNVVWYGNKRGAYLHDYH